ncbi:15820_t:CDS:1, partial [Cetraspora pellucida]
AVEPYFGDFAKISTLKSTLEETFYLIEIEKNNIINREAATALIKKVSNDL